MPLFALILTGHVCMATLAAVGAVAPSDTAAFTKQWEHTVTKPLTPMSVGVLMGSDTVVVGSRDCPDNTQNQLEYLSLATGKVAVSVPSRREAQVCRIIALAIVYGTKSPIKRPKTPGTCGIK